MFEKKKMKKNVLSKKERETNKKAMWRNPLIYILILYIIAALEFYFNMWRGQGTIYSTITNNPYMFLFTIFFPLFPLYIPLLIWHSNIPNPKYISWNGKGMYIINQRNKEEFIPWGKVKSVKWVGEYGGVPDDYPDYAMEIKGEISKRNVSEEIGKELKEYFENIKEEVEPVEIPFYKKTAFKLWVWILIGTIFACIVGYWIYQLG